MPRVHTVVKSTRGKKLVCRRCSAKILAGEKYFWWKFRHGGMVTNCHKHSPRGSELTQSRMGSAYAAIEGAQDGVDAASDISEIKSCLETCRGEIEQVRDEYQEGYDNMPENFQNGSSGEQSQEKIDELDNFISELESAEGDMDEDSDDEDALENAKQTARDALDNFSL